MIWEHPAETMMYVGIGVMIGIILAGIAQEIQNRLPPDPPP
jgi:hypothetical protein